MKDLSAPARVMVVSDLDWTMVDHDEKSNAALLEFNALWETKFSEDSLLVFSTGRSRHLYEELREEAPLLVPDVLVCSVGTEIFWESQGQAPDEEWSAILDQGWDNAAVRAVASAVPELQPQQESEQRPHKLSYYLKVAREEAAAVLQRLEEGLAQKGLQTKVVYSGGQDVDVLPRGASKGEALKYLLKKLPAATTGVQVSGDSGNDIELLAVDGVCGVMVSNAHPELRQWYEDNKANRKLYAADRRCAGGIVDGLSHFGLMPTQ